MNKKLLALIGMATVGFGLLQGARFLDPGSGPYSPDEMALLGLFADGCTFLLVAILSYAAVIESPRPLFAIGTAAALLYMVMGCFEVPATWYLAIAQILSGVGWSLNVLCWMHVFVGYRPRLALPMIALGYVIDVALQPLTSLLPGSGGWWMVAYVASILMLAACLRGGDRIRAWSKEEVKPQTSIEEAFSRTRRAVAFTFCFSFVCGFVVQLDIRLNGLSYAQTTTTAIICLVIALCMLGFLLLCKVRKVNIDYISPISALCLATVLVARYFFVGGGLAGSAMTSILISFYVFLWLMLISEAYERTLPAFFLLGIALAVARLSVCAGRLTSLYVLERVAVSQADVLMAMTYALVVMVALTFIFFIRYSTRVGGWSSHACAQEDAATSSDAAQEDELSPSDFPAPQPKAMELAAARYGLSAREAQIMEEYSAGRSARYIADLYVISEYTVKTHLRRAYAKMGVHSRQELLDLLDDEKSLSS